jgi:hypothetical protein
MLGPLVITPVRAHKQPSSILACPDVELTSRFKQLNYGVNGLQTMQIAIFNNIQISFDPNYDME